MRRSLCVAATCAWACARATPPPRSCEPQPLDAALQKTGRHGERALLPGGRSVQAIGQSVAIGQNPLHLALSPDGTIAAAELGVRFRGISIVRGLQRIAHLGESSPGGYQRGLAFSADGTQLFAANSGAKRIEIYSGPAFAARRDIPLDGGWPADLALSPDGARLYVTLALSSPPSLEVYDVASGARLAQVPTGGLFPQALLLEGNRVYVANEGAATGRRNRVNVFDANTLAQVGGFEVGKNPAALALSPDRATLYVAASDDDWIDRIDLRNGVVLQPLQLRQPGADEGPHRGLTLSPNALALSPDGNTLYVSAALLNAVLLIDTRTGAQIGALPAGFRPTALLLADKGQTLYVANAKGSGTAPDQSGIDKSDLPRGTLQRIAPIPSGAALQQATAAVAALAAPVEFAAPSADCARIGPLPAVRGGDTQLSSIHHVIYVLKENKTFDAVFGDFALAEASRDYLEWGAEITPNQHELARQYCLLDNFYVESEQSVEGHFWATAQVTNDYFERVWTAAWGRRVLLPLPLPPTGLGPVDSPRNGFLFDQLSLAKVAYRSYGEFVGLSGDLGQHIVQGFVDNPLDYLARPDTEKLKVFTDALGAGKLDPFTFITLQYDHTFGLTPGKPAPEFMVADNDRATGLLVEAVSRSPFWQDTLILITEDDPAGSADHVDGHRSFALVVSPFARRGRISHVRASFPSLAATAERALGVPPVSSLDAQAEPLWDCLTAVPDTTPFTSLASNVSPRVNPARAARRELDFTLPDRARGVGLELWQARRPGEPVPRQIREREGESDPEEEGHDPD